MVLERCGVNTNPRLNNKENVMSQSNQGNKLKALLQAVAMVGFGIAMMVAPDLMQGQDVDTSGRNSGFKQILMMIWGMPAGIVLTLLGGFIGFISLKKPSTVTSIEGSPATPLTTPAKPMMRSARNAELQAKVAPRKK
jgi:hypothetical protein